MSFESRLLTVERLLALDDGLDDLVKQALQGLRQQSPSSGNCPEFLPALYQTCLDPGGGYPTSTQINVFYPVQAVQLTGGTGTGTAPTLVPYGDVTYAYNDGNTFIPVGQDVLCLSNDINGTLVTQYFG